MQEKSKWQGLPYFPISLFYKNLFGEKVYKIPVSIAETCPNREGLRGMKPCTFCDVWGSAAYPEKRENDLRVQIESIRTRIRKRMNAHKFLVYFQAYTNTYARSEVLRQSFEIANEFDDVCGFVVGTRPDCLSENVFDIWNDFIRRGKYVGVELGVQSFNEEQLIWMSRGHTGEKSLQAIRRIAKKCPDVDLGIHLMFGLKDETEDQIVATAKLVSALPINNVKLHNLHVLKNTPLEKEYLAGEFVPISQEDYMHRVILFLQHLRPDIAVHRLTAVASRHDELIAPKWAAAKMGNYQYGLDELARRGAFQGQSYKKVEIRSSFNAHLKSSTP